MTIQGSIQKFFRVYVPNFSADDMNLPLVLDEVSRTPLPRKVTVESVSSGNVWKMEMTSKGRSNTVFLRDGWKKIVKDENLNAPTFLVFEFDGSSVFYFSMYDHGSMCKRMRSPIGKEVTEEENEESEETDDEEIEEAEDEESDDQESEVSHDAESAEVDDAETEEADDEESEETNAEKPPRRKERGGTIRRNRYLKTDCAKFKEYIDDELNPSFPVDKDKNRMRIPSVLIKDYNLRFPKLITLCDKIGTLKKKISVWNNGSVFLNGVDSFVRRNDLKPSDQMVFELKMADGYHGLVSEIKVHIVED